MPLGPTLLLGLLALFPSARAQKTDDSDLAGPPAPAPANLDREARREGGARIFRLERLHRPAAFEPPAGPPAVFGELILTDPKGRELPARRATVLLVSGSRILAQGATDDKGRWSIPLPPSAHGPASVRFRLENAYWSIRDADRGSPYEWEAAALSIPESGSVAAGTFRLAPGTENGKIGFIHLQFLEALDLFEREGAGLAWWKDALKVNYPGSADFFSPWGFELNLTRPEAWDVNLHELGHAVMAAGTRSRGGGGQHKIDECYNRGLAWSEGFATFFAAAVRLSPQDPDAKFEFLVPRRAPIRIEIVPEDVCQGDANEWRVAAGLWDLYDGHPDGKDALALGFKRLWGALQGQGMSGFPDAWKLLERTLAAEERAAAMAALAQNTLVPAPSGAPVASVARSLRGRIDQILAAPDWDGTASR